MQNTPTKPWSFDASLINLENLPESYIYETTAIENFLKVGSGNHERSLFLIGAKGCGKTLLLKQKAYLYQKKHSSEEDSTYQRTGNNELIHSLNFEVGTIDKGTLEKLCDYRQWVKIWKFSILLLLLRKNKIKLPEYLLNDLSEFPEHYSLSEIVAKLLNNSKKYLYKDFLTITNDLNALVRTIHHQSILFIDRLDQALSSLITNEAYDYLELQGKEDLRLPLWKNAQFGLLEAAYNLNTGTSSHIKIFTTARIEAMDINSNQRQNVEEYCTRLEYNDAELKEIFLRNIKNTPSKHLLKGKKGNLFYSFFGFEKMPHLQATTIDGDPIEEHVFNFLLRHTFRRPREIVKLGAKIYQANLNASKIKLTDRIKSVREKVNKEAYFHILPDYCSEYIPYFKEEYLEEFAKMVSTNIISSATLEKIENKAMLNYLYRMGLIGKLRNGAQNFLPPARHIYDFQMNIAQSEQYFIHPSFDRKIQEFHDYNSFHNQFNIIGHDYSYIPSPPFANGFDFDQDLEYYLPKEISGKPTTLDQKFPIHNIHVSLRSLYQQCFSLHPNEAYHQNQKDYFKTTFRLLSCIANNHFARVIESKFNVELSSWKNILEDKLSSFNMHHQYTAQIDNIEEGKEKFCSRQKGRFLVAGMYIFLEFDLITIKNLITNYNFTYQPYGLNVETTSKFIRKAFFLSGLKQAPLIGKNKKQEFLLHLSQFEKESLLTWWEYYIKHELQSNTHLGVEHIKHLNNMLK